MRLPCWMVGHDWGAWSAPQKQSVFHIDMWTGREVGPRSFTYEQFRTCDRCNRQVSRVAEQSPREAR